jgi:hypothetical protein
LTLLNDLAFVEIARSLAARVLRERPKPATDGDRLDHAVLLGLGRTASKQELAKLEDVLAQERAESPARGSETDTRVPPEWITVARVLLNLDEFVTRE